MDLFMLEIDRPAFWRLLVPTLAAVIILPLVLTWISQHPLAWLTLIVGMIIYTIFDGVPDVIKWGVRRGPLATVGLTLEYMVVFLLLLIGQIYNSDIQNFFTQKVVGLILNPTFGGSAIALILTWVVPILFVLYLMFRSVEFKNWRSLSKDNLDFVI